jgi:hypothetical protein
MSTTATAPTPTTSERPSGRHPVNVGQLVMGLAFLGMVGVWALLQSDVVDNGDVRWLLPLPWVLAGLGGLTALALTGSRRWGARQTGWVGADPADPAEQPADPTDTTTDTTVDETTQVAAVDDPTEEIR